MNCGCILECAIIVISVVGDVGLSGLNFIQRNRVLLDNLNWERGRCSKVPDLLALGLGILEDPGNFSRIHCLVALAQMEVLGDDLWDFGPAATISI